MKKLNRPRFEALLAKSVRQPNGCLIWTGYIDRKGYARYSGLGAYRINYGLQVGPIPEGMTVDHLCFEPRCVEVTHLRLLTRLENARNHASAPCVVPEGECINGHAFTPENTYVKPDGWRDCRTCIRERVRAYKARKRAAA